MKIKKITKKELHSKEKVYCLYEPENEEFLIKSKLNNNLCYVTKNSFNFGLLFGAGAYTIKTVNVEAEWKKQECLKYIEENKLDLIKNDPFLTVATDARNKFFATYSQLEKHNDKVKRDAGLFGYSRSLYGAFRYLPKLMFNGRDEDKKEVSHLESIALNAPIQNMESVNVSRWIIKVHNWLKENNMKSYLFLTIHDAIELMVHKDEISEVSTKVKELAEIDYEENEGIPLEVEGNVADYWKTYETKNWELWDLGHNWNKYLN